jgi:threonine/homoserine/homoserine lactone efflux protein
MSVVGAIALFAFAGFQLRTVFKNKSNSELQTKQTPFLAGVLLTGLNPFFIIWWLTVGFKLISDSIALWSLWGIVIMYPVQSIILEETLQLCALLKFLVQL